RRVEECARVGIVGSAEKGDPYKTRTKFPDQPGNLPARSVVLAETPVRFPPGRARRATRPVANASATDMTLGMLAVAILAAWAACVRKAAIMAAARRSGSAASVAARSPRCSGE